MSYLWVTITLPSLTGVISDCFQVLDPHHCWNGECVSYPSGPRVRFVTRSCNLAFSFIKTWNERTLKMF